MKMEDKRACPACATQLSGAMELCPVCVLRRALDGHGDSGESALERALEPARNRHRTGSSIMNL